MLKLNIGCGTDKLDGFINIDNEPSVNPDIVLDIRTDSILNYFLVDEIWMLHALEHIELSLWDRIFYNFRAILKPSGKLVLSYPEFAECSKRFLEDANSNRDFWRQTLYGRQLYPGDYHVVPMHSPEIQKILESYGFYRISYRAEQESFNTVMVAYKDPDFQCREYIMAKEIEMVGKAASINE